MDFELSADQVALREAASNLLDRACPTSRVREVASSASHVDDALWAAMAEQGWPAVDSAFEDGGLGLGMVEVAVLCEQLGSHLAPVPFAGTVMAHGALAAALGSGVLESAAGLGDADVGEVGAPAGLGRVHRGGGLVAAS